MAQHQHSKACCSQPMAQAEGYEPQGAYKDTGGIKTYVTGSPEANKAIFFIYDIFGYRPQTIQGADILAKGGDYLVLMPDLLKGKYAQAEWFDGTEEGQDKFKAWMPTAGEPAKSAAEVIERVGTFKKEFQSVQRWASIGYCWGGKLVSLSSAEGTPFSAGIQTSPAYVSAEDAEKVVIPMMMLASKDEPAADVAAFDKALKVPKHVETFETQVHGWMSARADLTNPDVKKEYERGYAAALDFLKEHM